MRDKESQHYFGLDIGTSMVRCVVGMVDPADPEKVSIIGHGSAPNLGMRKGSVAHIDDVSGAIAQAVTEAERVSGVQINSATINVNGTHVMGVNSKGTIAISAANREIDNNDRLRVEEAATIVQLPPNREIIQVFAKNYRVDGQDNIKDPVGMQGIRLEVDTYIVAAASPDLRSIDMALEKAQVYPAHRAVSSLASIEAILNRQQKESGTLVVDIGAGTTNLAVIEDGEIQHVSVLPVGGIYLTNDLAIGLKTDLDIAEKVKTSSASLAGKRSSGSVFVEHENKKHYFDTADVHTITEERIGELFELVDKELKKIHRSRNLPGGVVIVGGTANLPGIADFAKEKLQLSSRVGTLQPMSGLVDVVQDPSYSTAVGLMLLDMLLLPSDGMGSKPSGAGMLSLLNNLFRRTKR